MEQNFNNVHAVNNNVNIISIATPSCHCQDKEIIQNELQLNHSNATAMYLLDLALNLMLQHVDCCRASGDSSYEGECSEFWVGVLCFMFCKHLISLCNISFAIFQSWQENIADRVNQFFHCIQLQQNNSRKWINKKCKWCSWYMLSFVFPMI
jgi:hypothetical protein